MTFANRMSRVSGSAIMELLKATAGGGYISFASGLPDPQLFPTDALAAIMQDVLARDGAALQYGAAEGYAPLRAWVAERLRGRGLHAATPEHILITQGSQQALDLAARALLDPGDLVLIERPSYLAAIHTFDSYQATYEAVPVAAEGIDVARAAAAMRERRPRMIFTLPTFQNPTGVSLTLPQRQRLAELAAERSVPLLEDDAYFDLRYDGEPLPPVTSLAHNPLALYTGTFSKVIAPGLRVGYVYADPDVIARLTQLKQITDLHTGSLAQRVVFEYCARGLLDPQIERLRSTYRTRRNAMLAALENNLSGIAHWTVPAGGMFLLLTLPDGSDAAALLPRVMEQGVVYVPGASFHPNRGGQNTIRLNFVSSTPEQTERGIGVLRQVLCR